VYLDRIRGVRRHDVASALHRYLRADNASVAAILPMPRRRAARPTFARDAEQRVKTSLPAVAAPAAPAEPRGVLANGMVLLVRRDPSVPVVAMRAVWRGGQRVEDAAHAGAATLLARMMTRGCGALDATQVADKIDRLGGAMAGVAGRNSFGVAAEWLARTWKPGFELVADCILAPSLADAELARERRLVLDDQSAQADSPSQVAFRTFSEALYGDHPYARDALGTPDSIGALTRTELAAFYRARYPVAAMTLSIVGDVEPDEVIAAVKARFANAPKVARPPLPATKALKGGAEVGAHEVYRYLDRAQAHLVVGFPGATVDAADRFALEVLVAVLGGQSGRLFAELREKQALVYRVSAHSVEGIDPGFVAVYLSCAPDKLAAATAAVRAELARIRAQGVTAEEVERARSYLIGSHQIAMQRRAAVANAMAYHEAYGLGWQAWSGYDDAIRSIGPADVLAAAQTYLAPERAITATVRPPSATPAAVKRGTVRTPPRPAPARRQRVRRTS
jgi:zinc protease